MDVHISRILSGLVTVFIAPVFVQGGRICIIFIKSIGVEYLTFRFEFQEYIFSILIIFCSW
jgi:hypothetical protein